MHKRWDEYLVAEHEMIERAMAVLKTELEKLQPARAASFRLRRATDFLLQFGDGIHNVKEERHLFPLMEQRGIPTKGGPIGVMLAEHESERFLLNDMLQDFPTMSESTREDVDALIERGQEYLTVRANHIWKENDVLYAMGRRALSEEDNEKLLAAFDTLNEEVYGERAVEHFTAMLEELEKGDENKKLLIENLSYEQIHGVMEALPFEVTFVDAADTVAYFNRLDKEKIFVRTRSVIGRTVFKCHPSKSVDKVMAIVEGFKAGTLESAEFWIDMNDDKIMIRYFPVRSDAGEYLGVVEVTQAIGALQKIEGQKVLL